jgi:hypothetical protein
MAYRSANAFSLLDESTAAVKPAPLLPPLADDAPHPFETDAGDHAETPLAAFQHVAPLLRRLARRQGCADSELRLYDPYFCRGAGVRHLQSLGLSLINRNEDFYATREAGRLPSFEVLVSNPPFTGDHLERAFSFAWACNKPWFLLVPQYVARKAWFLQWQDAQLVRGKSGSRAFFLAPQTPYVFSAPTSIPAVRLKRGEGNAGADVPLPVAAGSFQCVWLFCLTAAHTQPVLEWWRREVAPTADCVLAASHRELPQLAKRKRADDDADGAKEAPPC